MGKSLTTLIVPSRADKGDEQKGGPGQCPGVPQKSLGPHLIWILPQGHIAFCHVENSRSKKGSGHGFHSNLVCIGDVDGEPYRKL